MHGLNIRMSHIFDFSFEIKKRSYVLHYFLILSSNILELFYYLMYNNYKNKTLEKTEFFSYFKQCY